MTAYVDIVDAWLIPKSAFRKSPAQRAEPTGLSLLPHPPILIPSMTGWWLSHPSEKY